MGPQQFYLPKMEKNYIKSSNAKSNEWAMKLENSPTDKHKAKYGDKNQADYLILAKEKSAEKERRYSNEIREEHKSKK